MLADFQSGPFLNGLLPATDFCVCSPPPCQVQPGPGELEFCTCPAPSHAPGSGQTSGSRRRCRARARTRKPPARPLPESQHRRGSPRPSPFLPGHAFPTSRAAPPASLPLEAGRTPSMLEWTGSLLTRLVANCYFAERKREESGDAKKEEGKKKSGLEGREKSDRP